jgi:hypothetical protein
MEIDFLKRNDPPAKGFIRMLRIPYFDSTNWIHLDLKYKDYTFRGWMDFISALEKPLFSISNPDIQVPVMPYVEGTVPHPYCHRHIAAGIFRGMVLWNIRMRWICRKWIARVRARIVSRRVIGTTDLVTMEPIPESHLVTVADYKSRSTYQFHYHTIQRIIREALLFQTYGISSPIYPKNPYTNIRWSTGQLVVLMEQIQEYVWKQRHRNVNPLLQWFREAAYNIKRFQEEHKEELHLLAANSFFKDFLSPEVQEIVEEVLVDILEELCLPKDGRVFQYVSKRSVPADIQKEWDTMVMCFWMYQNYRTVLHPQFVLYASMLEGSRALYEKTLEWIVSEVPKRRARRVLSRNQ